MAAATEAVSTRWAREYETIYILRPNVDPDDAEKVANRVSEVIDRMGGKLTKVDHWGKRKLAYIIRKHSRGIFVYVRYLGFRDLVAELERNLRLLEQVIRFQTIQTNPRIDFDAVTVDPEEIKFLRIEVTADDEEEDDRLELVAPAAEEPSEDEYSAAPEEADRETSRDAESDADKEEE